MEIAAKEQVMKAKMADILLDVSWSKISTKYFGRSRSWIYHKLDGIDGNGGDGRFSEAEKETLRHALRDLANRINACSDRV